MGAALAAAALDVGHEVVIVSGPVSVAYPDGAKVLPAVSTDDMLERCLEVFPECDGLIAAAAPCDYRPREVASSKLGKSGSSLTLELMETSDIVASLADQCNSPAGTPETDIQSGQQATATGTGRQAPHQGARRWMVAFALETDDAHLRAMQKLERKRCDLIVVNGPAAIHAEQTSVEVLDPQGTVAGSFAGTKRDVAERIIRLIDERLIEL